MWVEFHLCLGHQQYVKYILDFCVVHCLVSEPGIWTLNEVEVVVMPLLFQWKSVDPTQWLVHTTACDWRERGQLSMRQGKWILHVQGTKTTKTFQGKLSTGFFLTFNLVSLQSTSNHDVRMTMHIPTSSLFLLTFLVHFWWVLDSGAIIRWDNEITCCEFLRTSHAKNTIHVYFGTFGYHYHSKLSWASGACPVLATAPMHPHHKEERLYGQKQVARK